MNEQPLNAAQMRRAFDEAFARPELARAEQGIELLALVAGDMRMAVAIDQIAGIHLCPAVTAIPSDAPALLGVGSVRSVLSAIYSLSALRGGPRRPGQWLITCGDGTIGLAFDELCGYTRVRSDEMPVSKEAVFVEVAGKPHALVEVGVLVKVITG
ncbi:MAG: chemotaxis protein CheW [Planctomycetes bacterium]|nr:chemotaxis protein CheW [Planctomycetota bacterium]